jgi:hypothetical protein
VLDLKGEDVFRREIMKQSGWVMSVSAVIWLSMSFAAQADFILYGTEQLMVNTDHYSGVLYDQSQADITGGYMGGLSAYDSSTVNVSGGYVNVFSIEDHSTMNVTGGVVAPNCGYASGSSTMNISGGTGNVIYLHDSSTLNFSGGQFSIGSLDSSIMNVSGGQLSGLSAWGTSSVTFHARDFTLGSGLTFDGDRVLGTGILSGKWFDGTPWSTNIIQNDLTASILAVPEPLTLCLLAIGGLPLLQRKR